MHSSPLALLVALIASIFLPSSAVHAQAVGGGLGGGADAPPQPTQYPVVVPVPKLQVLPGGVTTTVQVQFTQTFAAGALETWRFGTPEVGKVGLGDIKGTVGGVKGEGG